MPSGTPDLPAGCPKGILYGIPFPRGNLGPAWELCRARRKHHTCNFQRRLLDAPAPSKPEAPPCCGASGTATCPDSSVQLLLPASSGPAGAPSAEELPVTAARCCSHRAVGSCRGSPAGGALSSSGLPGRPCAWPGGGRPTAELQAAREPGRAVPGRADTLAFSWPRLAPLQASNPLEGPALDE